MSLRFRCERCGKRLQVDQGPGTSAMCPHCRHVVVVPADAQPVADRPPPEAAQPDPLADDHPETLGDAIVARLAAYLPSWGTSVVAHLALVLLALTTFTVITQPEKPQYVNDLVQRPRFDKADFSVDFSRNTRRQTERNPSSVCLVPTKVPFPDVAANNRPTVDVIGLGGGGQVLGHLDGWGTGWRNRPSGPDFFGHSGLGARRIAFVVDRSGSMTDSIMYVKHELKRCLRNLRANEEFYVVFYSSGPAVEMPSRKLVPATPANKQLAYEFIDGIVPIGQTDPSDALKRAFEVKPDLVYFLTDGEFIDPKAVIALIDRLNHGKRIRIHTIGFLYTGCEPVMQQIARGNAGSYKYVGEDDLGNLQ